ncbi:hypothetical protein CAP36_07875 [Chitinophagaceae bacterium IBVUCB2]|nr:hypothetical protein CAP36_07875 [Chitinophagaceae bacterium IBVUCB2]
MAQPYYLTWYKDLIKTQPPGYKFSYSDRLNTKDWKIFRDMIVERDHMACKQCGIGIFRKLTDTEYQTAINLIEIHRITNPDILLFTSQDIASAEINNPELADKMREMKVKNNSPQLTGYKAQEPKPILEVHHKAYIYHALPWNYPEEWLETLCDVCHHKKHFGEGEVLPVMPKTYKDRSRQVEVRLDPCIRCEGKGYILEYKHFQRGVCFDCGGQGGIVD